MSKEIYIKYIAGITPEGMNSLYKILDLEMHKNCTKIHLLLSSPGGVVAQGLTMANFIRALPLDVYTYNLGTVDSICSVIFAAGKKRFCAPQSRFLLHAVSVPCETNDIFSLNTKIDEITTDMENISAFIADSSTKIQKEDILSAMKKRTVISAEKALQIGFINEIKLPDIKQNAPFYSVNIDFTVDSFCLDEKS